MTPPPSALVSALADRYRLERELGQGGMATVYLAQDLRHDRQVAMKVLKPELAAVLGADRFVQEIKTTAALQHPHILPLFDSGSADGFLFYVMPFIDGETLRARLDREHQLGIGEAVRITTEVADALDYAHRHGVVHRDIKPENILLHDGRPMVADFGIALAVSAAAGGRMTETGLSLGTPHYMSPEQATAEKEITGRSDIYSLASVLYEMLTGNPPHTGASAQQIIMKIVTEEVAPVTRARRNVPPAVAAAVLAALEKLPADRFATAREFADALEGRVLTRVSTRGTAGTSAAAGWRATIRNPAVWVLGALALASLGIALRGWVTTRAATPASVVRFAVEFPDGYRASLWSAVSPDLAISPDGSTIAFPVVGPRGARHLYVRRVDQETGRILPGTDGAFFPLFADDGSDVTFWAAGRVMKVALGGGSPRPMTTLGTGVSFGLLASGDLLAGDATRRQLMRISTAGGAPVPVAALDSARGETEQLFPLSLADGKHVLYTSWGRGAIEDARIGILDLAAGRAQRLEVQGTYPLGMLDGRLVYADQTGTILAVPLDLETGRVNGAPVSLVSGVATASRGSAVAALSASGSLVYASGGQMASLVLASASGEERFPAEARAYAYPRYSPDGRRVAVTIAPGASSDVWVADATSGGITRLTSGGTANERPEWSPDGTRILFRSVRGGGSAIWWQPADGSGSAVPLVAREGVEYFEGVLTPDGRSVVLQVDTAGSDVVLRSVDGEDRELRIATSQGDEDQARVSPDGRWVAYVTDESGDPQVVVQPLPGPGPRVQVSTRGGWEPVWSRDGRRIFYRADGVFMAADIATTPEFRVMERKEFMKDEYLPQASPHANYDVAPDGQRLLVLKGSPPRLLVVHNWAIEARDSLRAADTR